MNNYKIYGLTEPDGETLRYIGLTGNDIKNRFKEHLNEWYKNSYKNNWIRSLKREGLKPSLILIEDGLTSEQAAEKEIHYIKLFKSFGARLVNLTKGGQNPTRETKNKISNSLNGHEVSEETRYKLRIRNLDKKHTIETKEKCRMAGFKSRGIKHPSIAKKVYQFDLNGNFISEYYSARETKMNQGHIAEVCRGERKTAGGFIWKYCNN